MKREMITPRNNWQQKVEASGLTFHSRSAPYWNEEAAYQFSARQVDTLEAAANDVHEIALKAVQYVIDNDLFDKLQMTPMQKRLATNSWNNDELHLYGRFDFAYDGTNAPKMLEYNADTPTSLLEAAVTQWYWLEDKRKDTRQPQLDQFNSLHERLIARWQEINRRGQIKQPVHFASIEDNEEDVMTTEYLRDTAAQAGLKTKYTGIASIGYDGNTGGFVDEKRTTIDTLFKLYPWEWMANEPNADALPTAHMRVIEPAWKMILSNKGILPIMWQLAPNHPNLLEARYDKPADMNGWVQKPIYSREGANVTIHAEGQTMKSDGEYGEDGYIYQRYQPIKTHDGKTPVLGLWMIGDECGGMGIRESNGPITDNLSKFTPHYFTQ